MNMKKIILLLSVAIGFNAFAQTPSYVPTNGLVGWWGFNGNANDESGNANNGTVNGATVTTDRFGNSNSAYSFNGSSNYINVGNNINFNNSSFTISAWIKPASVPSNTFSAIVSTLGFNASAPFKGVEMNFWNTLRLTCQMGDNTIWSGIDGSITTQTQAFQLNQWYYCVITFDNTTLKMYLNNVIIGSANITSFLSNVNSPVLFGARGQYPNPQIGAYYNGVIDDIGIWNKALTPTEISNLYSGNICYANITVTDTLVINANLTGFNPITYQNTIKLYPNPSNDHITIDYGNYTSLNGYTLKITNSLGQTVFTTAINQQISYISSSSWSGNGLYFVSTIDAQGNTVDIKKIVIQ